MCITPWSVCVKASEQGPVVIACDQQGHQRTALRYLPCTATGVSVKQGCHSFIHRLHNLMRRKAQGADFPSVLLPVQLLDEQMLCCAENETRILSLILHDSAVHRSYLGEKDNTTMQSTAKLEELCASKHVYSANRFPAYIR